MLSDDEIDDFICTGPGFGNGIDCVGGAFCPIAHLCGDSCRDTIDNYCPECGYLNVECECDESI